MNRAKLFNLMMLMTIFSLVYSCGPASESPDADESDLVDETLVNTPFTREVKFDTCLLIAHKVKAYDVWKASFDIAQSIREKHGIKALSVYRDRTDTSLALVYTQVTNLKSARDYITSQNLQKSMASAGVMDAMDLYWMTRQLSGTEPITDSILMFMSFKVMNYDRWESAFLEDYKDEPNRENQVKTVMRGIDDPNQVSMIFAVNDIDYVEKMEKNNVFRAKMLASGVVSYPVTYKLLEMQL
jgi:hypothetical protein